MLAPASEKLIRVISIFLKKFLTMTSKILMQRLHDWKMGCFFVPLLYGSNPVIVRQQKYLSETLSI